MAMTELASELSPGADFRDLVEASGEVTQALKTVDVERLAIGSAMMGAAFAGIAMPGSFGGAKRLSDEIGRLKRAHKSRRVLKDEIQYRWPDAKELDSKEVTKQFEKEWKKHRIKEGRRWKTGVGENKFHPPYDEAMPSYIVKTTEGQKFMRVVSKEKEGKPAGRWLIRKEDCQRVMSEADPRDVFGEVLALPDAPFAATEVTLPTNTKLCIGVASPHAEWGKGGALQFDVTVQFNITKMS